jgi:hypothetical protein
MHLTCDPGGRIGWVSLEWACGIVEANPGGAMRLVTYHALTNGALLMLGELPDFEFDVVKKTEAFNRLDLTRDLLDLRHPFFCFDYPDLRN